jgi:hypothetical protein
VTGDLTEAARIEAKDLFAPRRGCLDSLRQAQVGHIIDASDTVAELVEALGR